MPYPRHLLRTLVSGAAVLILPLTALTTLAGPAGSAVSATVADPHGDREPSATEIRSVDGTNVVFAYGEVMPAFEGWSAHEPTRGYVSLDRRWKFAYDTDNVGETAGWFRPGFDDSRWGGIDVPSSWDLKDNDGWAGYDGADFGKGGSLVDGYGWYRTKVTIPDGWRDRHVRLNFLGAFYSADVWVNGTWAGKHEGGHTPFALPVSDALRPGQTATIAVRVYRAATYTSYDGSGQAIADDKALPSGPVDFWPYAGLTRSVWLEAVPAVTVSKLLLDARDGTLDARAIVENHGERAFSGKVVLDPGPRSQGKPVTVAVNVPAGGAAVASARVPIPKAPRWSTTSPAVLDARATLTGRAGGTPVADTLSSEYGMRSVTTGTDQLLLNGKPLFLKGYNWHEETDRSGRSMTRAEYDHELGQAKTLGANFLRNAVYNRHPYVYDWSDRNGVVLLDEWDTMWISEPQQRIQLTYGLSEALATATAWNNHNHPSVIMWGLQNESTPNTSTYHEWLRQMRDAVKAVDLSDRPVTWASATSWDQAFDLADVVGFNEYFGYFYGKDEDLSPTLDAVHANHPGKPILITENGTWSFWGNHGSPGEVGTEEHHAEYFQAHWDQVVAKPYVAGYAFWVLKDYKQRRNYNMDLNGLSYMGMLRWDGDTPRVVYDYFRRAEPPAWSSGSAG
ncbi:glycoside hydrolase family 2 protein [Flindersiella endophytica]